MIPLIKGFQDGIRPEKNLLVSDWADKHRILSNAAESGKYRSSRTPYLIEPMNKMSPMDPCQKVVVMKGAQGGWSEAGFNCIGAWVDMSPSVMMYIMPTDASAKRNVKLRIDPMIRATPVLSEKIQPARSRDSGNTQQQKDFAGGSLIIVGANSPTGLKSTPAGKLVMDEVDEWPLDLDDQGSPIDLAEIRANTFSNRKILIISTPTIHGVSVIEQEFQDTDQRHYHVPCPHCFEMQILKFDNLQWDEGKYETARFVCVSCGTLIEERYKNWMLPRGEWIAKYPEKSTVLKAGYHWPSFYSPLGWLSWAEIAYRWDKAQSSPEKLKVVVNTVFGETWTVKGESPDWQNLWNRRETYKLEQPPASVVFLTAGVDVQKDRLELEVVGWCKDKSSYSISYRVIPGDVATEKPWKELEKVVTEQWIREDGSAMPLRLMCVDSGAYTSHVYEFCRKFSRDKVLPIKGGSDKMTVMVGIPKVVDLAKSGKKIGKLKVWMVGGGMIKSELYGWLRLEQKPDDMSYPHGYCHFPEYGEEYFKGLTAEHLVLKKHKGFARYEWEKKEHERNEPLDCRVYNRAAAVIVGLDRMKPEALEEMANQYARVEHQAGGQSRPKKKKESYWDS